jgi:Acetyltransferase (GNAT) family
MIFSNRSFKILKHKIIYDGILRKMSKILGRIGLAMRLYYIFKEGLIDGESKDFGPEYLDYEITFLTSEDMQSLDRIEGRYQTALLMQNRIINGHKCLGIKINGKVIGFTWCQFGMFAFPPLKGFTLLENEAYLDDMYILNAYRGSNLAPFLRYRCYQELAKIGRTVLYSVSLIPNDPAIRFKIKLDARIVSLGLYIRIGKDFHWCRTLKKYEYNSK